MNFLLIEDDSSDSLYIKEILHEHQVDIQNKIPSLDLNLQAYDFIISDYFIHGEPVTDFLISIQKHNKIVPPVIIASGKLDDVDLTKIPIEMNALVLSKNDNFKEFLFYYIELIRSDRYIADKKVDYKTIFYQLVHDLRNDLNLAYQYQFLESSFESMESELEYLRMVKDSGVQAYQKILHLGKFISQEKIEFDSLAEVVEKIFELPTFKKRKDQIKLRGQTDKKIEFIPAYFLNVLLKNFIENSFKYANFSDAVEVELKVNFSTTGMRLEVIDNGSGMTDEEKMQLFYKKSSSKTDGLGMGLVIINRIVSMFDGNIKVVTKPNVGTSIILEF
ncbi:MAG: ATP-binding protein [Bacteriovoracaceae bacterium]|jgi:signal transduction histidine kinase|nr:hypothetical protein [Halobacteriovoraceae bacterium]MDP7321153.1 ATP-binding protein [Bacteriovoracaceae bacterium]